MSLPYNNIRSRPRLKDLLDTLKRDIFLTLNCNAVATVVKVNSPTPDFQFVSISAQMNYVKTFTNAQGNQYTRNYSVPTNVPVWFMCGGNVQLTTPVAIGDQVLICFNDRDLDLWKKGARGGQVNSPRAHDFSDGIAFVGLNNISSWDAVRALMTNGNASLGINSQNNKVMIGNSGSGTLGNALTTMLTTLTTFFTAASTATTAAQIATAAAAVSLAAVESDITGLLE